MTDRKSAHASAGGFIALLFATFVTIGSAIATSANTDVSDIWWNRNKSGNGHQLVNTGTFVFATGYLYGQDRQPFWYSAELDLVPGAAVVFSGPLYVTMGPWFGGPYDPANVTVRQAGTMTFELTGVSTANLTYTIDGVTVTEPVERQPLTLEFYGGFYRGVHTMSMSECNDPALNGVSVTMPVAVSIFHDGTQMSLTRAYGTDDFCKYDGTYSQAGRMGTFSATYACSDANFGSAIYFQMTNQPFMFMARTREKNGSTGCTIDGELVGVVRR